MRRAAGSQAQQGRNWVLVLCCCVLLSFILWLQETGPRVPTFRVTELGVGSSAGAPRSSGKQSFDKVEGVAAWHQPSPFPGHPLVQFGDCMPFCDRQKIRELIPAFIEVYRNRPHKNNLCGCQINHAFIAFAVARLLNPKVVIENGVNGGMTTYLMRSALPNAHIYSIDPAPTPKCPMKVKKFLGLANATTLVRWKNPHEATYYTGDDFKDFHDIDWSAKGIDKADTLVFFDTHKSDYNNAVKAARAGFRWVLFDDNFPAQDFGDMSGQSLKQVLSRSDGLTFRLYKSLEMYYEMPPIVLPWAAALEKPELIREFPRLELMDRKTEDYIDLLDPVVSFTAPLLDLDKPEDLDIFRSLYAEIGEMPEFHQWNHMAITRLRNF